MSPNRRVLTQLFAGWLTGHCPAAKLRIARMLGRGPARDCARRLSAADSEIVFVDFNEAVLARAPIQLVRDVHAAVHELQSRCSSFNKFTEFALVVGAARATDEHFARARADARHTFVQLRVQVGGIRRSDWMPLPFWGNGNTLRAQPPISWPNHIPINVDLTPLSALTGDAAEPAEPEDAPPVDPGELRRRLRRKLARLASKRAARRKK